MDERDLRIGVYLFAEQTRGVCAQMTRRLGSQKRAPLEARQIAKRLAEERYEKAQGSFREGEVEQSADGEKYAREGPIMHKDQKQAIHKGESRLYFIKMKLIGAKVKASARMLL